MHATRRLLVLAALTAPVAFGTACFDDDDELDAKLRSAPADELWDSAEREKACKQAKIDEWGIHFKDEFDTFDDTKWTKFDDRVVPNTETCHQPESVTIEKEAFGEKGVLRIATREKSTCKAVVDGGTVDVPYTGGALHSYGKFWTGKYFKAEVRAKVSQEYGIFGAPLWFRPGDALGELRGPGPIGGEIDVVESLGVWAERKKTSEPKLQMTLHPDYSDDAGFKHQQRDYKDFDDPDGDAFHTYTVEKIPGGITIWIDGKHAAGWGCGHKDNKRPPRWFKEWFEDPSGWSMRVDNKAGGGWAKSPNRKTDWGNKTAMYIDYIKVWRPKKVPGAAAPAEAVGPCVGLADGWRCHPTDPSRAELCAGGTVAESRTCSVPGERCVAGEGGSATLNPNATLACAP